MINRDPQQRNLYEARLKVERDVRAKLDYARQEGRQEALEEGREEGRRQERIRLVQILRNIVGDDSPMDEELTTLSLDDLALLESEFQRRLRDRS